MEWNCLLFNCNRNKIETYNILDFREDWIKKIKKKTTKEEFALKLKQEMQYHYWSRSEYELILTNINDRIMLSPWVGSKNPEAASIDVTDRKDFDWEEFTRFISSIKYMGKDHEVKIDVWDQLEFKWNEFVNYCWYYHHKYQRKYSKFDQNIECVEIKYEN